MELLNILFHEQNLLIDWKISVSKADGNRFWIHIAILWSPP